MGEAFLVRRGGGISRANAILTVAAPTGATVTATKGGVTLTPTMWVRAADNTQDCALFAIKPSLFDENNAWTVTAALGADSASEAVTISTNKQYDVFLSFGRVIYRNGGISTEAGDIVRCGTVASGYSWGAFTKGDNAIVLNCASGTQEISISTDSKVSGDGMSKLVIHVTDMRLGNNDAIRKFGLFSKKDYAWMSGGDINSGKVSWKDISAAGKTELDISSCAETYYVGVLASRNAMIAFDYLAMEP